jgi:hypothetical protein
MEYIADRSDRPGTLQKIESFDQQTLCQLAICADFKHISDSLPK